MIDGSLSRWSTLQNLLSLKIFSTLSTTLSSQSLQQLSGLIICFGSTFETVHFLRNELLSLSPLLANGTLYYVLYQQAVLACGSGKIPHHTCLLQRWFANCHKSFVDAWLIKSVSMSSAHHGEEVENRHLQETNFLLPQPRRIESISWTLLYFTYTYESEYDAGVCCGSSLTTHIYSYSHNQKHFRHHQNTFDICFLEWLTTPLPTDRRNKLHVELPIGGLKTQPMCSNQVSTEGLTQDNQHLKNPTINRSLSIHSMAFWDFCPLGQNGEATDNQAASNLTWDAPPIMNSTVIGSRKTHLYCSFFTNGGFTVYAVSWCTNLSLHQ